MRSIAPAERLAAGVGRPWTVLYSLIPTAVFLIFERWLGLVPAMISASVAALVLIAVRRRGGQGVGILLPISLGYVAVKAVAGVVSQSQVVYFGSGLALTALITLVVGATAFTSRPVASYLMPLVTPYRRLTPDHAVYRRVAAQVTMAWAVAELGITAWEAWHLTVASASEYVVKSTIVSWPIMGVLIFFMIGYVRFRLDRYEHYLAHSVAQEEQVVGR